MNQFVESVTDALAETGASEDVLTEVEEAGKELAGEVEELETEVRDQSGGIQELRRENQQLRSELSDYRENNELEKASIKQRVNDLEEAGTGDANPGGDRPETNLYRPESPLESVVALPEHLAREELSANQERARFLAMDVADYSKKVPAGRSIDSGTIRKVLKAKDGKAPHTETVSRVLSFLDDLGKGGTKVVKRRGTRRVIFQEETVERLEALSEGRRSNHDVGDPQNLIGV